MNRKFAALAVLLTNRKFAALAMLLLLCVATASADKRFSNHTTSPDRNKPRPPLVPYTTTVAAPSRFKSVAIVSAAAPQSKIPAQWEWVERGKTIRLTWIDESRDDGQPPSYRIVFSNQAEKISPTKQVTLLPLADQVAVTINGLPFTSYYFKSDAPKPFLHPLRAASGVVVTRGFPVERDIAGEPRDHPHHRAWWFSHGDVNGADFWGEEGEGHGRIVHRSFEEVTSGAVYGRLVVRSEWVTAKGERLLEDRREITFYNLPEARMIDFVIELRPIGSPVKFGDTKEGSFAIRVGAQLQAKGATGRLENSLGGQGEAATWGKRADWCDYSGTVEGQPLGVTIFDHPSSFRHAPFWMVRDYGLFATNAFGERAYTGDPKADGSYTLATGKTLTIRHRVLIHAGDATSARLPQYYRAYAEPSKAKLPTHQTSAIYDWKALPENTWVKLPTTGATPAKVFHGGMALDTDRGQLLVFGSDSHRRAKDFDNSVYRLDLTTLQWRRDYPADPVADYLVGDDRVARTKSGRPWGEHSFDTLDYAPTLKRLVTVQFPDHAFLFYEAGRFDKQKIRPVTWLYDADEQGWESLDCETPNLFAKAMTYDSDTRQMVGCDGEGGTWLFDLESKKWTRSPAVGGPKGWHLSMEYDTQLKRVLAYGSMENAHDLWAFEVAAQKWERLETPTQAPVGNGAALAYSTSARALIFLASLSKKTYNNKSGESETWVFDSVKKDWRRLAVKSPPLYGMNYHNVYDPERNVMLFGERGKGRGPVGGPLAIWAFRYAPASPK